MRICKAIPFLALQAHPLLAAPLGGDYSATEYRGTAESQPKWEMMRREQKSTEGFPAENAWLNSAEDRISLLKKHLVLYGAIDTGEIWTENVTCTYPEKIKWREAPTDSNETMSFFLEGKPFTYIRWGDGEFQCGTRPTHHNAERSRRISSDHNKCETLQENLLDYGSNKSENLIIVAGAFFFCSGGDRLGKAVDNFFKDHSLRSDFQGFYRTFNRFYFPLIPPNGSLKPGSLTGVVPRLVGRRVALVGPRHLNKLYKMLGHMEYIPSDSAWEDKNKIIQSITDVSRRYSKENVVFICAGGVAMKVILYEAFKLLGQKDTFIDVGASLDSFAGVASRDYNRDLSIWCRNYPDYMADSVCPSHQSQGSGAVSDSSGRGTGDPGDVKNRLTAFEKRQDSQEKRLAEFEREGKKRLADIERDLLAVRRMAQTAGRFNSSAESNASREIRSEAKNKSKPHAGNKQPSAERQEIHPGKPQVRWDEQHISAGQRPAKSVTVKQRQAARWHRRATTHKHTRLDKRSLANHGNQATVISSRSGTDAKAESYTWWHILLLWLLCFAFLVNKTKGLTLHAWSLLQQEK